MDILYNFEKTKTIKKDAFNPPYYIILGRQSIVDGREVLVTVLSEPGYAYYMYEKMVAVSKERTESQIFPNSTIWRYYLKDPWGKT